MGMRLLRKSEVDQKKAVEQTTAVNEGLKLARSVDNLREIRADEERSLEEFRVTQIEQIHNKIKTEQERLDILKKEVADLEDRKREAQKPLDSAWDDIQQARIEIEARKAANTEESKVIRDQSRGLSEQRQGLEQWQTRLERWDALSYEGLQNAATAESEATHNISVATDAMEAARRLKRNVDVELTHREQSVTSREERATVRETEQTAREADYAVRMTLLKDREEMVKRDLQRTKK